MAMGLGKNAFMNALLQGVNEIEYENMEDKESNLKPKIELEYNGKKIFSLDNKGSTQSSCLGMYEQNEIYYIDCPLLYDKNLTTEYRNQSFIRYAEKKCDKSLILLVIRGEVITSAKGKKFVQQVTSVMR